MKKRIEFCPFTFNLKFAKAVLLAAATSLHSQLAAAVEFIVHPRSSIEIITGSPIHIDMIGEIDASAPMQLENIISRLDFNYISVYMDSPGGSLLDGIEIGKILREFRADTKIGRSPKSSDQQKTYRCYSACALAFLGGKFRYFNPNSYYGVHLASIKNPSKDDLLIGQVLTAIVGQYIRDMGVDGKLLNLITSARPDQIYILSKNEQLELRVVNDGRDSSFWSIEAFDGGSYIEGIQETVFGTGKFRVICDGQRFSLMSSYTAGQRSEDIIIQRWEHSILFNGKELTLAQPFHKTQNGIWVTLMFNIPKSTMLNFKSPSSIGHAIKITPEAPTFIGYTVDLDKFSTNKFSNFIGNCIRK